MARNYSSVDGRKPSASTMFNIPKFKTQNTGILEYMPPTDREARDLIEDVDRTCFFPMEKFRTQWELTAVHMAKPTFRVEEDYRLKRVEMRSQCRSHQSQEILGFFICKDKFQARKIARYGIRTDSCRNTYLGNPSQGVYLYRYLDVALLSQMFRPSTFVFVLKVQLGRVKKLSVSKSSGFASEIEPTPNFDAHGSLAAPQSDDPVSIICKKSQIASAHIKHHICYDLQNKIASAYEKHHSCCDLQKKLLMKQNAIRRMKVYLYEYRNDTMPARHPHQCLPYALLEFSNSERMKQNLDTNKSSENITGSSCVGDGEGLVTYAFSDKGSRPVDRMSSQHISKKKGYSPPYSKTTLSPQDCQITSETHQIDKTEKNPAHFASSDDNSIPDFLISAWGCLSPSSDQQNDRSISVTQSTSQIENQEARDICNSSGLKLGTAEDVMNKSCSLNISSVCQPPEKSQKNDCSVWDTRPLSPLVLNFQDPRFYEVIGPSDFEPKCCKIQECSQSLVTSKATGHSPLGSSRRESHSVLDKKVTVSRDPRLGQRKAAVPPTFNPNISKGDTAVHNQQHQHGGSSSSQNVMAIINRFLAGSTASQQVETDPTDSWGLTWNGSFCGESDQDANMELLQIKSLCKQNSSVANVAFQQLKDIINSVKSGNLPSHSVSLLSTEVLQSSVVSDNVGCKQTTVSSTGVSSASAATSESCLPKSALNILRSFTQDALKNVGMVTSLSTESSKTTENNGTASHDSTESSKATKNNGTASHDYQPNQWDVLRSFTQEAIKCTAWHPPTPTPALDIGSSVVSSKPTVLETQGAVTSNQVVTAGLSHGQLLLSDSEKACRYSSETSEIAEQKKSQTDQMYQNVRSALRTVHIAQQHSKTEDMYHSVLSALQISDGDDSQADDECKQLDAGRNRNHKISVSDNSFRSHRYEEILHENDSQLMSGSTKNHKSEKQRDTDSKVMDIGLSDGRAAKKTTSGEDMQLQKCHQINTVVRSLEMPVHQIVFDGTSESFDSKIRPLPQEKEHQKRCQQLGGVDMNTDTGKNAVKGASVDVVVTNMDQTAGEVDRASVQVAVSIGSEEIHNECEKTVNEIQQYNGGTENCAAVPSKPERKVRTLRKEMIPKSTHDSSKSGEGVASLSAVTVSHKRTASASKNLLAQNMAGEDQVEYVDKTAEHLTQQTCRDEKLNRKVQLDAVLENEDNSVSEYSLEPQCKPRMEQEGLLEKTDESTTLLTCTDEVFSKTTALLDAKLVGKHGSAPKLISHSMLGEAQQCVNENYTKKVLPSDTDKEFKQKTAPPDMSADQDGSTVQCSVSQCKGGGEKDLNKNGKTAAFLLHANVELNKKTAQSETMSENHNSPDLEYSLVQIITRSEQLDMSADQNRSTVQCSVSQCKGGGEKDLNKNGKTAALLLHANVELNKKTAHSETMSENHNSPDLEYSLVQSISRSEQLDSISNRDITPSFHTEVEFTGNPVHLDNRRSASTESFEVEHLNPLLHKFSELSGDMTVEHEKVMGKQEVDPPDVNITELQSLMQPSEEPCPGENPCDDLGMTATNRTHLQCENSSQKGNESELLNVDGSENAGSGNDEDTDGLDAQADEAREIAMSVYESDNVRSVNDRPAKWAVNASTSSESHALPLSILGLQHWTEALVMPSLSPELQLVDLREAYLGKADFDNCAICQKVIDWAFLLPDDQDEQTEIKEASQCIETSPSDSCTRNSATVDTECIDLLDNLTETVQYSSTNESVDCTSLRSHSDTFVEKDTPRRYSVSSEQELDKPGTETETYEQSWSSQVTSAQGHNLKVQSVQHSSSKQSLEQSSQVQSDSYVQPPGKNASEQSAGQHSSERSARQNSNEQSSGQDSSEQLLGQNSGEQSTEQNFCEQLLGQNRIEQSAGQNFSEQSTEQNLNKQSARQNPSEKSSGQISSERLHGQISNEELLKQKSSEQSSGQNSSEQSEHRSYEQPTENRFSEQSTANSSSETLGALWSSEWSAGGMPMELSAGQTVGEQPRKEEQSSHCKSKEQSTRQGSSEQSAGFARKKPASRRMSEKPSRRLSLKEQLAVHRSKGQSTQCTSMDQQEKRRSKERSLSHRHKYNSYRQSPYRRKEFSSVNNSKVSPAAKRSKELSYTDWPRQCSSANRSKELSSKNRPKQLLSTKMPKELPSKNQLRQFSSTNRPSELSSINRPSELSSTNRPNKLSSTNRPNELSSTNRPSELSSINRPSELSSTNRPSELSSTNRPSELSSTNSPSELSSTNRPIEFSSTNSPSELSSTNRPSELSSTNRPSELSSTNSPIELSSTNRPSELSSTNRPKEHSSTNRPKEQSSTNRPSEQSSTNRPKELSSTNRPSEQSSTNRPSEQSSTNRLNELSSTNRPSEQSSTNRRKEQSSTNRPNELSSTNRPNELSSTIRPNELSSTNRPSEQSSTNRRKEQSSTNRPNELSSTNRPNELSSTNRPNELSSTNRPKEHSSTNRPSELSSTNRPKEHSSTNRPKEQSSTNRPSEQSSTNRPKELSSTNRPSEQSSTNRPSEQSSTNRPNELSSTNRPNELSSTNRPNELSSTNRPKEHSSTNRPSELSSTNRPKEHSSTNRPKEQSSTNRPSEQSSTNRPKELSSTNRPSEQSSTNRPSEQSSTNRLNELSSTNRPSEQSSTNRRKEQSSTNRPNELSSTNRPSEQSSTNRRKEQSSTNRPNELSSTNRPNELSSTNRPNELSSTNRPSEQSSTNRRKEQSSTNRPNELSSTNRPNELSSTNRPNELSSTNRPKEHSSTNRPKEQSSTNRLKEHSSTNRPKEQSSTNRLKEHSSTNRPKEHSSTNRPKEQSSTNRLKEHSSTNRLKEHSSTNRLKEHSSTNRLKEQSSTNRPKEQSSTNRPKEHSSTNKPKEQSSTNRPKEQSSTNKPKEQSSTNRLNELASKNRPKEQSSTNRPNEHSSTSRPNELSSTNRPKEHSSTNRLKEHSSTNRPKEHSSTNKSKEHSSANRPKKRPSTDGPRELLSVDSSTECSSAVRPKECSSQNSSMDRSSTNVSVECSSTNSSTECSSTNSSTECSSTNSSKECSSINKTTECSSANRSVEVSCHSSESHVRESLQQQSCEKDVLDWFSDIVGEKRKAAPVTESESVSKKLRQDMSVTGKSCVKQNSKEPVSAVMKFASCSPKEEYNEQFMCNRAKRCDDSQTSSSTVKLKVTTGVKRKNCRDNDSSEIYSRCRLQKHKKRFESKQKYHDGNYKNDSNKRRTSPVETNTVREHHHLSKNYKKVSSRNSYLRKTPVGTKRKCDIYALFSDNREAPRRSFSQRQTNTSDDKKLSTVESDDTATDQGSSSRIAKKEEKQDSNIDKVKADATFQSNQHARNVPIETSDYTFAVPDLPYSENFSADTFVNSENDCAILQPSASLDSNTRERQCGVQQWENVPSSTYIAHHVLENSDVSSDTLIPVETNEESCVQNLDTELRSTVSTPVDLDKQHHVENLITDLNTSVSSPVDSDRNHLENSDKDHGTAVPALVDTSSQYYEENGNADPCSAVPASTDTSNQYCVENASADPCNVVPAPTDMSVQHCVENSKADPCASVPAPTDVSIQQCVENSKVDPCASVPAPTDMSIQQCVENSKVDPCASVPAPTDMSVQQCVENSKVDPCASVPAPTDMSIQQCVENSKVDPCASVPAPTDMSIQQCVENSKVDPCASVPAPTDTTRDSLSSAQFRPDSVSTLLTLESFTVEQIDKEQKILDGCFKLLEYTSFGETDVSLRPYVSDQFEHVSLKMLKKALRGVLKDFEMTSLNLRHKGGTHQCLPQERHKILLENYTGDTDKKSLDWLQKYHDFYTICEDHLRCVVGPETVAKMPFFRTNFEAVQRYQLLVQREIGNMQ